MMCAIGKMWIHKLHWCPLQPHKVQPDHITLPNCIIFSGLASLREGSLRIYLFILFFFWLFALSCRADGRRCLMSVYDPAYTLKIISRMSICPFTLPSQGVVTYSELMPTEIACTWENVSSSYKQSWFHLNLWNEHNLLQSCCEVGAHTVLKYMTENDKFVLIWQHSVIFNHVTDQSA